MSVCGFGMAWIGRCKEPAEEGCRCEKHAHKVCVSCGAPATHECDETGQFVCGADLCDECEHTIFPGGTNGGIGFNAETPPEGMRWHCKKTEQKYRSWWARREEVPEKPKAKLVIIRGVPGSGKTTKACTLGIPDHYEADMWFAVHGGFDSSFLRQAHAWCRDMVEAALIAGRPAVVANTFTRLWELEPYVDMAESLNIPVEVIRMGNRFESVHDVPAAKVEEMLQRFEEYPGEVLCEV